MPDSKTTNLQKDMKTHLICQNAHGNGFFVSVFWLSPQVCFLPCSVVVDALLQNPGSRRHPGSSGSVVARRLAENASVKVLLLEAGGEDDVPGVIEANQWPVNLGSERDWSFQAQPNPRVNGRAVPLSMGRVVGGGSSINVMVWARGHKSDWDFFASEAGDPAWNYESVLNIYRRIEDWHGAPDPKYRGTGGPVFVEPAPDPNTIAPATLEGARSVGIPTFENPNGRMMECKGGASITDVRARAGKRQSVFRSVRLPVYGPAESDSSHSRTGHPADLRGQASHWRGVFLRRQDPSCWRGS